MLKKQFFVWLDLETTGLQPAKHSIVEVGFIITDYLLAEKYAEGSMVIQHRDWSEANEWCIDNHLHSGLIAECLTSQNSVFDAEKMVMSQIDRLKDQFNHGVYHDLEFILAGNSPHFDRAFIRYWMESLDAVLHYRMFDVTAVDIFHQIAKGGTLRDGYVAHRSLPDAIAALAHAHRIVGSFTCQKSSK